MMRIKCYSASQRDYAVKNIILSLLQNRKTRFTHRQPKVVKVKVNSHPQTNYTTRPEKVKYRPKRHPYPFIVERFTKGNKGEK